jgi:hypothetical protein
MHIHHKQVLPNGRKVTRVEHLRSYSDIMTVFMSKKGGYRVVARIDDPVSARDGVHDQEEPHRADAMSVGQLLVPITML